MPLPNVENYTMSLTTVAEPEMRAFASKLQRRAPVRALKA